MAKKPKETKEAQQKEALVAEDLTKNLTHLTERNRFHALILANPNYFGNLEVSQTDPVISIQSNTFYEEIGCVGYQPEFERLEAVVYVKQPAGYGGGICSHGSKEYVRFYLTHDNGATWEDLGLTGFRTYDIPKGTVGRKRLEYAVSLQTDLSKMERFCFIENLCQVRAILSWNFPPPPNQPNWKPIWGNIHDTHIQIQPWKIVFVKDIFKELELTLPAKLKPVVDLNATIPVPEPPELELAELKKLYKPQEIAPQRLLLTEMHKLAAGPEALMAAVNNPGISATLEEWNVNINDFVESLFPKDGSVFFEEMECIGYNPNLDTMVATIRIKRPTGYLGRLCQKGSREYVTFWADTDNNGTYDTCLGTTSVKVHDINSIPAKGLEYAVFLPANLKKYQQPCYQGARVIPIRAIMSWQVAPPCNNPNFVPVYGNREETLVHVRPGRQWQPGVHIPFFETLGSMLVDDISNATGLADGPSILAGFTADQSPFGGRITITGGISNTTDISAGASPLKYSIEISDDGIHWNPLTNRFKLYATRIVNGIPQPVKSEYDQIADVNGFYTYREDLIGSTLILPVGNVLGYWYTGGLSGRWYVRLKAKNSLGFTWYSGTKTIKIDNKAPEPDLTITSGGGACADFTIGDVISGSYSVSDQHFGRLSLAVQPAIIGGTPSGGSFTSPPPLPAGGTMPLRRSYAGGVSTFGEAGAWSLDTKGMPKCGYTIELNVWDRTIVNSGSIGFHNRAVVGLCLRNKQEG